MWVALCVPAGWAAGLIGVGWVWEAFLALTDNALYSSVRSESQSLLR